MFSPWSCSIFIAKNVSFALNALLVNNYWSLVVLREKVIGDIEFYFLHCVTPSCIQHFLKTHINSKRFRWIRTLQYHQILADIASTTITRWYRYLDIVRQSSIVFKEVRVTITSFIVYLSWWVRAILLSLWIVSITIVRPESCDFWPQIVFQLICTNCFNIHIHQGCRSSYDYND